MRCAAIALVALTCSFTLPATASELLFTLQMRLAQEGHYSGEVDGRMGPATRYALESFQAEHGGEATPEGAYATMRRLARNERREVTDVHKQMVGELLEGKLFDPYSADVRYEYAFEPNGQIRVVCGRVNAKNRYGAFTGFGWFNAVGFQLESGMLVPLAISFDSDFAVSMCEIGTHLAAGSR